MRLSSPELLIDITGLKQLANISLEAGVLSIGALVTHAQIEGSEVVRKHAPLLAEAVPHVAHPAIRNRGTIGGSLALADPAAEYPACAVAVKVPAQLEGERSVFLELARRHGDYAIVGLAAFKGAETRFAFLNAGPTAVLAKNTALKKSLAEAKVALKADLDPPADLYNSSATKLHLAGVLLERAWNALST